MPAYSLSEFDYIAPGKNSGTGELNGWLLRTEQAAAWLTTNASEGTPQPDTPNLGFLDFGGSLSAPASADNSSMVEQAGSTNIAIAILHHA